MTRLNRWPGASAVLWGLGVIVVLLMAATACTAQPLPEVVVADFECAEPIDRLADPPAEYAAVLDAVALPALELHQLGQSQEDAAGIRRTFSKMGLLIRRDVAVTLVVAEASRGNALISWSNTGQPGPVEGLAVAGCSGADEWLVYPGGVWVVDPACVELSVEADGQRETVRLPIGERCA